MGLQMKPEYPMKKPIRCTCFREVNEAGEDVFWSLCAWHEDRSQKDQARARHEGGLAAAHDASLDVAPWPVERLADALCKALGGSDPDKWVDRARRVLAAMENKPMTEALTPQSSEVVKP